MSTAPIYICYHGDCLDGLGGAFAAWKKFGDTATYVPLYDRVTPPPVPEEAEVYLIDFSFPETVLRDLEAHVRRLVVLDHHIGAREAVLAVAEHVFDNDRSGAHIAWEYFHPGVRLPRLLAYIEDNDLWRHAFPDTTAVSAYLAAHTFEGPHTLAVLVSAFEKDAERAACVQKGVCYAEYARVLCRRIADRAYPVEFEGYRVYAVNGAREFSSEVGNILAVEHPPFGIVWYMHKGNWHVSLRGDGTVDLSALAARYGGGGHHSASAFRLPPDETLPFVAARE